MRLSTVELLVYIVIHIAEYVIMVKRWSVIVDFAHITLDQNGKESGVVQTSNLNSKC
jgi:hypothetical protein